MDFTEAGPSESNVMNMADILARLLLLEAQVKAEHEARVKLEERCVAQEQQLKERKTDIAGLKTTNNKLKAELKKEIQDREADKRAVDLNIQQEAKKRKAAINLTAQEFLSIVQSFLKPK